MQNPPFLSMVSLYSLYCRPSISVFAFLFVTFSRQSGFQDKGADVLGMMVDVLHTAIVSSQL